MIGGDGEGDGENAAEQERRLGRTGPEDFSEMWLFFPVLVWTRWTQASVTVKSGALSAPDVMLMRPSTVPPSGIGAVLSSSVGSPKRFRRMVSHVALISMQKLTTSMSAKPDSEFSVR